MDHFEQKMLEKMDELIRTLKDGVYLKKKPTMLDYLLEKKRSEAFQGSVIIDDPCKPEGEE